jgi:hypothetical protein
VTSDPDPKHISTSYVERQNLTMRRFTRLTNALSQKVENHAAASRSTTSTTTSGASIRRCASLLGWKVALRTTCGALRKSSHS